MKNFLQNLLIFLSLCLCGLIAFQWVRETDLRKSVQQQTDTIQTKTENILNLEAQIKRDNSEIQRLDGIKNQLTSQVQTNEAEIKLIRLELGKSSAEIDRLGGQLTEYKDALAKANTNLLIQNEAIKQQNESIKKQNDDMVKLANDRNEVVTKYNKLASEYKDLVDKWNAQQEQLAKAATNPPSRR